MNKTARTERTGGRALFYLRDSLGRHEQTPGQYVGWASREAEQKKLDLDGDADAIKRMIRDGIVELGDLYLDYDVKGNLLSRPALDAMRRRVEADLAVERIFIPKRERFARPDDPFDGDRLEMEFRHKGITLHYMDRILPPVRAGGRRSVEDSIISVVDYHAAGKYRYDLADKMIWAQINLATGGFSTGGQAPFFLRRWLVDPQGNAVRELRKGEVVRMAGHHVVWLPSDQQSLDLALRILEMLEKMPAYQVAATLTNEGIPSPDAGRLRTYRGVRHQVSGVWHETTINDVARSAHMLGLTAYGRRSMGDQMRFSPTGPRELTDDDYRDDSKPKIVQNSDQHRIVANAKHEPLVDVDKHKSLLAKLDKRAGSQKGKPKARDPNMNPLGTRIVDMDCRWPMYRIPHKTKGLRYRCGLYTQSHGAKCNHNQLDGVPAVSFVLSTIRQRLLPNRLQSLIRDKLTELAHNEAQPQSGQLQLGKIRSDLSLVVNDLKVAQQNLARAKTQETHDAVAEEYGKLNQKKIQLEDDLSAFERTIARRVHGPELELAKALSLLDRITELSERTSSFAEAKELFDLTDVRLFVKFERIPTAKPRKDRQNFVNRLSRGIVTFGNAPAPIPVYEGLTSRAVVKPQREQKKEPTTEGGLDDPYADGEDDMLGKPSRGDRI